MIQYKTKIYKFWRKFLDLPIKNSSCYLTFSKPKSLIKLISYSSSSEFERTFPNKLNSSFSTRFTISLCSLFWYCSPFRVNTIAFCSANDSCLLITWISPKPASILFTLDLNSFIIFSISSLCLCFMSSKPPFTCCFVAFIIPASNLNLSTIP